MKKALISVLALLALSGMVFANGQKQAAPAAGGAAAASG
jgi:hypothetical protein